MFALALALARPALLAPLGRAAFALALARPALLAPLGRAALARPALLAPLGRAALARPALIRRRVPRPVRTSAPCRPRAPASP